MSSQNNLQTINTYQQDILSIQRIQMQGLFKKRKNQQPQIKPLSLIRERDQPKEQNYSQKPQRELKKYGSKVIRAQEQFKPRQMYFQSRQRENYVAPQNDVSEYSDSINQSDMDGNLIGIQNQKHEHSRLAGREILIKSKNRMENQVLGQLDEQDQLYEEETVQQAQYVTENIQQDAYTKLQKIKKAVKIVAGVGAICGLAVMAKNGFSPKEGVKYKGITQKITSLVEKTKINQALKSSAYSTAVSCALKTGMDVLVEKKPVNQSLQTNIKQSSKNMVGSLVGGEIGSNMPIVGPKVGRVVGSYIGSMVSNKLTKQKIELGKQKTRILVKNLKRKTQQMFTDQ